MHMISHYGESTLHRFPTVVHVPCALFSSRSGHSDKSRETVPVNNHLDEMFELISVSWFLPKRSRNVRSAVFPLG